MNGGGVETVDASEIVVQGAEEYVGCCISNRPGVAGQWHAWARAERHCLRFKDLAFSIQLSAVRTCHKVLFGIMTDPEMRAQLHQPPPVKWGWGRPWRG